MLKILNLNLWNYNNFEKRKPFIIDFIKKHKPDIIIFQEVRDDLEFNKEGENQAKQINKSLKFPFELFCPVTDKRNERPEKYKLQCLEGTAILSKFPIMNHEIIQLKKYDDCIYSRGNVCFKIKAEKEIDFIAVHFAPNEIHSKLDLKETLDYVEKKKISSIIVGDFNFIDSNLLFDLTKENFMSSYEFKNYISYPKANFTLDYILIPNEFSFRSFQCLGTNLSDHKVLIAEIELK